MYKVSVVVPIHNMEQYLEEALESIINQTIGFENIQVILVNDGSTDGSLQIINQYVNKYSNIQVIDLLEKSGAAGKPRNEGIKLVEAPYMMFLDPDDLFAGDAIEKMYNAAIEQNVDIVTGNYVYMEENGKKWNKKVFDETRFPSFRFSDKSFSDSFFVFNSACWNKLFKTKLIEDNNIQFLEGVPAEDAYFTYASLLAANDIYYLSDTINYYRRRSNSGVLSVSWDRSLKYFKNISYAYKKIFELFESTNKMGLFRYFYSKTLTSVFYKIVDTNIMNENEKQEALKELRWFFSLRKNVQVLPCQNSIEYVLDKVDEEKYYDAMKCCDIIKEMRTYIEKDIREGMSKPEFINYVEL